MQLGENHWKSGLVLCCWLDLSNFYGAGEYIYIRENGSHGTASVAGPVMRSIRKEIFESCWFLAIGAGCEGVRLESGCVRRAGRKGVGAVSGLVAFQMARVA